MDLPAHRIAKVSGIGCSSKAPTYFLSRSHGFNSVHGRMPSVTTGAAIANRDLVYIGVSGDGDTASIGLGQFCHAVRRRLNMTYIVMNNGCYGLTKGQFSATNDKLSPSKKGEANPFDAIDLCQMAIQLGAGFVARSFSGDKAPADPADQGGHQLQRLCLPRRDQPVRDLQQPPDLDQELRLRARPQHGLREQARLRRAQGGDHRRLCRGHARRRSRCTTARGWCCTSSSAGHDPRDADAAIMTIRTNATKGEVATGLLYINEAQQDMHDILATDARPLNALPMAELCPGSKALEGINARLR